MSQADGAGRIEAFLSTLEKLPPLRGVTSGAAADAEFVRDGQAVVTQGLVPTSRNIDVATEGGTTAIYAILSLQGRDISSFSAACRARGGVPAGHVVLPGRGPRARRARRTPGLRAAGR